MKVLATFDGSPCAEAVLPQLRWLASVPDVEFVLLSVADVPHATLREGLSEPVAGGATLGVSQPAVVARDEARYAETSQQARERRRDELRAYLHGLLSSLPVGPRYAVDACIADDAAAAIIERAMQLRPDVIAMATHGHSALVHVLFGDVAEQVVRAGVAPVLLVQPDRLRRARGTSVEATAG